MNNYGIKYFDLIDFSDDNQSEIDYSFIGWPDNKKIQFASISGDFETALNNFADFIDKNKRPYVKLVISSSRKANTYEAIDGNVSIFNLKKITSTCASKRIIYLSPKCDEVYGERYDVFQKGSNTIRKFWFDYRCLYSEGIGDYEAVILPKNGELVQTKFIKDSLVEGEFKEGYCYFPACTDRFFNYKLYGNSFVDKGQDVYYGFITRTNIKSRNDDYQDYYFFDTFDNFVPAATLEQFVIQN